MISVVSCPKQFCISSRTVSSLILASIFIIIHAWSFCNWNLFFKSEFFAIFSLEKETRTTKTFIWERVQLFTSILREQWWRWPFPLEVSRFVVIPLGCSVSSSHEFYISFFPAAKPTTTTTNWDNKLVRSDNLISLINRAFCSQTKTIVHKSREMWLATLLTKFRINNRSKLMEISVYNDVIIQRRV